MIYTNVAQGNNVCLATMAIKIARPNGAALELFFNGFVDSPRKANALFAKWATKWIKDELNKFSNQREKALQELQMLTQPMSQRIAIVRKIAGTRTEHETFCQIILENQESIRLLVPSASSRFYFWNNIIEEILHYAAKHAHKSIINQSYKSQNNNETHHLHKQQTA